MHIGIVGAESAKFTQYGMEQARGIIRTLLAPADAVLVSGHCHLGGVDIWAEEIADELGRAKLIYPPARLQWEGGYKQRNLLIARQSAIVHCIAVDFLPMRYTGMQFATCYHCVEYNNPPHIKSGGCWTMHRAKVGALHVVKNLHPPTTGGER